MWVFDVKTQRFLAVNEAAVRHYGYTREQFLRLTVRDILPLEDLDAIDRHLGQLSSDTESFGIWRHRTKDGSIIHVEVLANEIDFNNHRARLVLAHDITSRLRIERSLRTAYSVTRALESSASFRGAIPGILRAICEEAGWEYGELWQVDQDRDALRWGGAWSIPGFPSQDLEKASASVQVVRGAGIPGKTWATGKPEWVTDLTPQARFYRAESAARLGLKQALAFPITGHGSRVLGVMVFFSRALGEPDEAFLELMVDLGNRAGQFLEGEYMERERRRVEERFAKAFYQNPLPGIISRLDGSRIIDVNESFVRTFGFVREELVGRTSAQAGILYPVQERDELLEPLTRGESVRGVEAFLRTKSGELRTGLLWSERVEMGPEPTILTMIQDVTDLRRAQARLLDTQRLASIGETAAFVAHELNTPLTNISLLAASIRRQTAEDATRERLDKIDAQRRLAARIIEEVMSLTRRTSIDQAQADIAALLRSASDQAAAYRKPGVELTLELGDDPVVANVDALKVSQVFVNLIKNAYQATERGSVTVSLTQDAGTLRISVRDTGKGMTAEEREHLFQPFFTTKPHGEGVGLGLMFVKTVVGAHGGAIELDTEPGRGTAFTIRLPVGVHPDPQG